MNMKTITFDADLYKLVPIEPTEEMCQAGNDCQEADPLDGPYAAAYEIFKAMLAVSPPINTED